MGNPSVLLNKKKVDHITTILCKLHWPPVRKRIIFKVLLITYKVVNGLLPKYLADPFIKDG